MATTRLPDNLNKFFVGVSWDFAGSAIDLDVQAVAVDNSGCIVDAAYYNNVKALGGSLVHSGDDKDGKAEGVDEQITVHLQTMPAHITAMVFVVCCYTDGQTLADVKEGQVAVVTDDDNSPGVILHETLLSDKGANSACILLMVFRDGRSWFLRPINETCNGRHFMDLLEGINYLALKHIFPKVSSKPTMRFQMEKGGSMEFFATTTDVRCGLGWDITKGKVDIDASCCIFDAQGRELETVYFGNLKSRKSHSKANAVVHSGDNLTGVGDGDDEVITVHLDKLGPTVQTLVFVITIYSGSSSFSMVANPYCRMLDNARHQELCSFKLNEVGPYNALVIAQLKRNRSSGWGFQALGVPARGHTYSNVLPLMSRIASGKLDVDTALAEASANAANLAVSGNEPQSAFFIFIVLALVLLWMFW